MSSKTPEVTDALHGQRLEQIDEALKDIRRESREFRDELRQSLKPISAEVKQNSGFRERAMGALAIAAVLTAGGIGWLSYMTVTTIRTEEAVQRIEDRHPSKAPEHAAEQ